MGRKLAVSLLLMLSIALISIASFAEGAVATPNGSNVPETDGVVSPTAIPSGQVEFEQVSFSPDIVSDVQKATLTYTLISENRSTIHTAELTDEISLSTLETLLSEAEQLKYEADCFSENADNILTLFFEDGTQTSVSVALDSCTIIRSEGVYYNFMPPRYRGLDEHPDNTILYSLFSVSLF